MTYHANGCLLSIITYNHIYLSDVKALLSDGCGYQNIELSSFELSDHLLTNEYDKENITSNTIPLVVLSERSLSYPACRPLDRRNALL